MSARAARPVRPRALAHRGRVLASGLYLPAGVAPPEEFRRRVLASWLPGSLVQESTFGTLLRWPSERSVDVRRSPGTPLVARAGLLLAAPLSEAERLALGAAPGSAVVVQAGAAVAIPPSGAELVDPADWLALEELSELAVETLGAPPAPPARLEAAPPVDLRATLAGIPPPSPEQVAFLRDSGPPGPAGRSLATRPLGVLVAAVAGRLAAGTARGLRAVARFGTLFSQALASAGRGEASHSFPPPPPPRPSLFAKLAARAESFAARLLAATRLEALLGRRHAEHLGKVLDLFARGDTLEALRQAIPIDGAEAALTKPAFGTPAPRNDLTISLFGAPIRSVVNVPYDVLAELRRSYRAAFMRLAAQNKVDEAAFVLAELLQAHEEAVAFLEKHGRLRLAAELSEARKLPSGLVVRQWLVAGDVARAVALARRSGAFADAVLRLERTASPHAAALRLLWAEALADAGEYARAVEAARPVREAAAVVAKWIELGIEAGGPAAATLLARRVQLQPDALGEVAERVAELLADDAPERAAERRAFANALAAAPRTDATRALARPAVRAALRDAVRSADRMTASEFGALVEHAGSATLKADLPPYPTSRFPRLADRAEPLEIALDGRDGGTTPIADAAFLPSGRLLVALGEAGVRLLGRDGKPGPLFDAPAHRLVVADSGAVAVALAFRGELVVLRRLDLVRRTVVPLGEAELTAFAPTCDGSLWFAARKDELFAVDLSATRFETLWETRGVGEEIVAIARDAGNLVLFTVGERPEEWRYQLPSLTLRSRTAQAAPEAGSVLFEPRIGLGAQGLRVESSTYVKIPPGGGTVEIFPRRLRVFAGDVLRLDRPVGEEPDERPGEPAVAGSLVVSPLTSERGTRVRLVQWETGRTCAEILLGGAQAVRLFPTEKTLTLADERGRLLVLDLADGSLLRNLRL